MENIIILTILFIIIQVTYETEVVQKCFGQLGPPDFSESQLVSSHPLWLQSAFKEVSLSHLWSDEALIKSLKDNSEAHPVQVMPRIWNEKHSLKEMISLLKFLERYHTTNISMISSIPPSFRQLLILPWPLQCSVLNSSIIEQKMWLSDGKSTTQVLDPQFDSIFCQMQGSAIVILASPQSNATDADFLRFDQDMDTGEILHTADLQTGDCLYVPKSWLFQLRRNGRSLTTSLVFSVDFVHPGVFKEEMAKCTSPINQTLTLDQVEFLGEDIADLKRIVAKWLRNNSEIEIDKFLQGACPEMKEYEKHFGDSFTKPLVKVFSLLDINRNMVLDWNDYYTVPLKTWHKSNKVYKKYDRKMHQLDLQIKEIKKGRQTAKQDDEDIEEYFGQNRDDL